VLAYFLLVFAILIETLLPDRFYQRAQVLVDRIGREFEIDTIRLGAPSLQLYQWWVPVLAWVVGMVCLHRVLNELQPVLAVLLNILVLLYGLRFKHFADVFTSLHLFLNQRDFVRAKTLLSEWVTEYGSPPPDVQCPDELIAFAVRHGAERALRQFFCIVFWFFVTPGLSGVVLYMAVLWSVVRERQLWQQQHPQQEHPTVQTLFAHSLTQTALSPRSILFVLEWLPTRLLLLTIAFMSQFDEVLLSWRLAASAHRGMSNRSLLTAVCLTVVGVTGYVSPPQALRQFRQLILRCVLVWLFAALGLVVLG
jgi:adenosylcobinamide-phosphate synthase